MTQPGPQRSYGGRSATERRADRRARLLAAGLEAFGTVGYAMSPVGRICKIANLSTRQYYEEFAGREALLVALYDQINEESFAAVSGVLAETAGQPLPARVATALRTHVRQTAADLKRARVAYVEIIGVNAGIEAHRMGWRRRWVGLIGELLRGGVQTGELVDRDYRLAAGAFIGAVNGLLQDWCATDDRAPIDDVVDELARLAAALITAPA